MHMTLSFTYKLHPFKNIQITNLTLIQFSVHFLSELSIFSSLVSLTFDLIIRLRLKSVQPFHFVALRMYLLLHIIEEWNGYLTILEELEFYFY